MDDKRYLKIFENQSTYESQKDEVMGMPHVVLIDDTKEIIFVSETNEDNIDYASQPFTLVALEDGTMDIAMPSGATFMNYSLNDGEWIENTGDIVLEVKTNDKVKLKGNAQVVIGNAYTIFDLSMPFNVEGNIMSLLYGDDFQDKKTIERENCFYYCFYDTNIVSAKNLILLATTLMKDCYSGMFYKCTSLVEAPELPATTLAESCYKLMFRECTSLVKAPQLPATTLAMSCYYSMFSNCTSLTEAPKLPATTLAESCYSNMFDGCTFLTTAPSVLPATTLVNYCYYCMFQGCGNLNKITMLATAFNGTNCLYNWVKYVASSGTFIKSALMNSLPSGDSGIPEGWTVENYQK